MDLVGDAAIVTGGAQGIGRGIAEESSVDRESSPEGDQETAAN